MISHPGRLLIILGKSFLKYPRRPGFRIQWRYLDIHTIGKIAQWQEGCGCGTCGPDTKEFAKSIGYSERELKAIPDETNLAPSCGNPTALASPQGRRGGT